MRTVSFRVLFFVWPPAALDSGQDRSYTVFPLPDIQVGSAHFWRLMFFFLVWFDYLHDIFSGKLISNSPEASNQQNTNVCLIAWLRKDRKKLELDTHTHTQTNPMDGRNLATTGMYRPCQQTHG